MTAQIIKFPKPPQYLSTDELIGLAIVKFIREVRKINEAYGVDITERKGR